MNLKEFLKRTYLTTSSGIVLTRPAIICKDGFIVSCQAAEWLYCSPRENIPSGDYDSVELGYPSELDDLLADYAEESNTTQTVFSYVPINIVQQLIDKHGGIDWAYINW